jgi:hypothetical protein
MAGKIDPAGNYTGLGLYDTLKDCKMYAGLEASSSSRPRSGPQGLNMKPCVASCVRRITLRRVPGHKNR